tara:strand:+ start:182 stop:334 length:153 start_codon:yes stop_codon:yes gene_type:complete
MNFEFKNLRIWQKPIHFGKEMKRPIPSEARSEMYNLSPQLSGISDAKFLA